MNELQMFCEKRVFRLQVCADKRWRRRIQKNFCHLNTKYIVSLYNSPSSKLIEWNKDLWKALSTQNNWLWHNNENRREKKNNKNIFKKPYVWTVEEKDCNLRTWIVNLMKCFFRATVVEQQLCKTTWLTVKAKEIELRF